MILMKKLYLILFLLLLQLSLQAQCVACKQTVEAQIQNGTLSPDGINNGIVYLMLIPYLLLLLAGYVFYKNYKKWKSAENTDSVEG